MGTELVKAALHHKWAVLSPVARLVWIQMCMRAIDPGQDDERQSRTYYGGHAYLVFQISGLEPGQEGYGGALRKVERAIAELRGSGAVRLVNSPRSGHRANYTLHPDDLFTTGGDPL